MTIAADDVTYKIEPEAEVEDTGTETSSDPVIPEERPTSPTPSFRKPVSPPPPPPHPEAGPSWEATWRDLDLSAWDFLENPFKRVHDEPADLQTQYYRLEHITQGANRALDNCGPGNILRELAKRADWKELKQLKTEKAQLTAHVTTMTQELSHENEEVRKYHAEQAVVFSWIRDRSWWDIRGRSSTRRTSTTG